MTDIDYYYVQTEYGRKIAVDFDYDEQLVNKIQQLRDHRWEVTHCSAEYENDEFQYWTIDPDPESIERFESVLDVYVPSKFKPDTERDDVEIVVPEGESRLYLTNPPSDVDRLLDDAFSFEVEDAEYTTSYQNGTWDGIEHVYSTTTHSAPVGLLDKTVELLEGEGYNVDVEWEHRNDGIGADFEWNFEYDLRPYQQDAVSNVLENAGGIVGLPTGTGKTVVGLKLAELLGRKAIVFVHTQELLYQWADEVRDILGVEPGLVGDDQWTEGDEITIAIMQTLDSRGVELLDDDYGVMIFDECHRTSAAETFHEVGLGLDGFYRIGLSATPWRTTSGEELKIEGAVGGVAHTVTAEDMIDEGYLAEPVFEDLDPAMHGTPQQARDYEEYHEAYERCIEFDPVRNKAIAQKAAKMTENGRQVLVNVSRISQAYVLGAALNQTITVDDVVDATDPDKQQFARQCYDQMGLSRDYDACVLTSETPDQVRKEMLEAYEAGEYDILVSTLVKEGVDIPSINGIVLAHGQKSDIETIQVIGRALRANGGNAKIVDVRDRGRFFESAYETRQATMSGYYGSYGPNVATGMQTTETGIERPVESGSNQTDLTSEPPTYDDVFGG